MEKPIENYKGYTITDDGKIISYKMKQPKILKTYIGSSGYEEIRLSDNNITYHESVHRLVAKAFIPNPNNLPEVNHIDGNKLNNNVSNLEWINHIDNIHKSYITSGLNQIRNYKTCKLYSPDGKILGEFQSVIAAARFGEDKLGLSKTSLDKYRECKGYKIIKDEDVK